MQSAAVAELRVSSTEYTQLNRDAWSQVAVLTVANLKARYRKTMAGFLWVVLNPLILYGAQSLVFSKFLKLNVPNYSLFLLSGLLPWIFLNQSLEMCTPILVSSGPMLKSYPVHPLVFLIAQLADNLVNFVAAFFLILIPIWIMNPGPVWGLLLLPLPLATLAFGVAGLCLLLATAHVFFRDTRFMVTFLLGVSFFLTPIFYPQEFVPESYRWLVAVNPFNHLIAPFRFCVYAFEPVAFARSMAVAAGVAAGINGLAFMLWRRKRNAIYLSI